MADQEPVRLHCFAHSGEDLSVLDDWAAIAGPGVRPPPVPPPGRTRRRTETPTTAYRVLLADVLPQLTAPHPGPYALHGHGPGAMVTLAAARALHEARLPGPALLAVGACPSPRPPLGPPGARRPPDPATPPAGDGRDRGRAALPVSRRRRATGPRLQESVRRPSPVGPLTVQVLVAASRENPPARPATTAGRRHWTTGPVRSRTGPGRHFFVRGGRELPRLLGQACRIARRLVRGPAPVG
uniref:Thioesterase n=1 Tax=Streptomyces sp. CNH189 TaxID=1136432 RepID=M4T4V2_9ACTN|nr:thioesterase [Streptomyces sp. CNH189]